MSVQEKSVELLKQAIALARSGRRSEARPLFLRVLDLDPNNVVAWLWRASVAADSEEARHSLERALELDPENRGAIAWLERLDAQERTATGVRRATVGAEGEAEAMDEGIESSGFALLDLERLEEAAGYLRAASELQPQNPRLRDLAGRLRRQVEGATATARGLAAAEDGPNRTVLVADGDPQVRRQVISRLPSTWRILQATDGGEAVRCLERTVPDLILLSADLRPEGGRRICEMVKGNDLTRDVPVVVLQDEEEPAEPAASADLVLGKPLEPEWPRWVLRRFFGD